MTEAGYARILLDKKDTQIMELESEITKLRIEYERQIKKMLKENTDLKAQIEKMKCCQNCKHFDKLYNRCELTRLTLKSSLCTSLDKWELRR